MDKICRCLMTFALFTLYIKHETLADEVCKNNEEPKLLDSDSDWAVKGSLCLPKHACQQSDGKCGANELNYPLIRDLATKLRDGHMLPLKCQDPELTIQMAIGMILLKSGYPQIAIDHYNKVLDDNSYASQCAAIYYGRGFAYTKLGLDDQDNVQNCIESFDEALEVASFTDSLPIYEKRAETFMFTHQYSLSYRDYTEAINILPSFQHYLMRGVSQLFRDKYNLAVEDFTESLKLQPHQPAALHYKGTCLYHMHRVSEAIEAYEECLTLEPNKQNVMQSLAQAYHEVGNIPDSLKYYNKLTALSPDNPTYYQYKGECYFSYGRMRESHEAFNICHSLQPSNQLCLYFRGITAGSMGQFYRAIKDISKATAITPMTTPEGSTKYPGEMYAREWCRYVHSHLNHNTSEYDPEKDINPAFKEKWTRHQPFVLYNYTEQPGLQPNIKDVEVKPWNVLPSHTQSLLCQAYNMGKSIQTKFGQYDDIFHYNQKHWIATGLSVMEVSQTVKKFWKNPKTTRNKFGKSFSWKDAFEIVIKWTRFVDINTPVFWIDKPFKMTEAYYHRLTIIRDNQTYEKFDIYLPKIFHIIAQTLPGTEMHYHAGKDPVECFYNIFKIHKAIFEHNLINNDYFIRINSKLTSKKDRAQKSLDGFSLLIFVNSQNKLTVLLDFQLSWAKIQQYHAELDYLWNKITNEFNSPSKSAHHTSSDTFVGLIISLTYYFINLMPISSHSTASISYTTTVGLLLALGRDMIGNFPPGKDIRMEAITIYDPDQFKSEIKSHFSFKKITHSKIFDDIADTFPTTRSMFEVLQYDYAKFCNV